MSAPVKRDLMPLAYDVAVRIYVELVARNTVITEGAVKMGASATNLAALSSCRSVVRPMRPTAAKAPITTYKLKAVRGVDQVAARYRPPPRRARWTRSRVLSQNC
jgi:hypothetical protein